MAKLIKLTEKSWILKSGDSNNGILFDMGDQGYLVLNENKSTTYKSLDDVKKRYGSLSIAAKVKESTTKNATFKGYPTKHGDAIDCNHDTLPVYKKETGKVEYVAGYWGLLFSQGWTAAYCPKFETTKTYKSVGPFKNRLEMLNHLSSLNTNDNLAKINDLTEEEDDTDE